MRSAFYLIIVSLFVIFVGCGSKAAQTCRIAVPAALIEMPEGAAFAVVIESSQGKELIGSGMNAPMYSQHDDALESMVAAMIANDLLTRHDVQYVDYAIWKRVQREYEEYKNNAADYSPVFQEAWIQHPEEVRIVVCQLDFSQTDEMVAMEGGSEKARLLRMHCSYKIVITDYERLPRRELGQGVLLLRSSRGLQNDLTESNFKCDDIDVYNPLALKKRIAELVIAPLAVVRSARVVETEFVSLSGEEAIEGLLDAAFFAEAVVAIGKRLEAEALQRTQRGYLLHDLGIALMGAGRWDEALMRFQEAQVYQDKKESLQAFNRLQGLKNSFKKSN